jgi:sirohydrochlorin cobaltochelatase
VGCRHVAVQPVFLGAGGHVRRDLPLLVAAVQAKWPELHITVATAIGEVEAVLDAMATAALQAALPDVSYDGSVAANPQGTAK